MAVKLWPFGKAERRESVSVTDTIIRALTQAAEGSSPPSVEALGAVEAAAGLWSRALSSASVEPRTPATMALTPSVLAAIGRGLAVRGEAVFQVEVNGAVELLQAASWEVSGGVRPESWRYKVKQPLPGGGAIERTIPAEAVLHLRYATRPGAPWAGISPLGMAAETRALATWIERRLAQEAQTAMSNVLALPDGGSPEQFNSLKDAISAGMGKLHLLETTAQGWGQGPTAAPRGDYDVKRIGANPPESLGKLRDSVKADIFGVYGIPSSIHGTGGSARESYRQFLSSTIQPLARIIVEELADKLDTPTLALDFTELRAADIAGRARAYGVLINAGMPPAEAAEATGLE